MKLCLSCMRPIKDLAGRCPYCCDDEQGVLGRIILISVVIVAIVFAAKVFG